MILKPSFFSIPLYADTDYRDMSIAIFGQGTADETDIIGCPAAASCLGNDDSRFVQVVFTGSKGGHDLSHNDEGRVAGRRCLRISTLYPLPFCPSAAAHPRCSRNGGIPGARRSK